MERRKYTREFKLETVNMMKGRGVWLHCSGLILACQYFYNWALCKFRRQTNSRRSGCGGGANLECPKKINEFALINIVLQNKNCVL